jgi:dipeptidyl aminopeptidase/acylaminoacyl peptidase
VFTTWRSDDGEQTDIYVMNADGSDERPVLANHRADETRAAWSPDGRRLAYTGLRSPGHGTIFVVGLDGRGRRDVSHARFDDSFPVWSPNGKWIAYVMEDDIQDTTAVYVIHPDGTGRWRLSEYAPEYGGQLSWSPDGRLAFIGAYDDSEEENLVVADVADRSVNVLPRPFEGGTPVWSPDGKRIAYLGLLGAIFTMRPDGSGRRRLARTGTADSSPTWSSDGKSLLFVGAGRFNGPTANELDQVWTMRADGSHKHALTHEYPDGGSNSLPVWVRGELASEAPPRPQEAESGDRTVLRVPFPVDGVSADGARVAIAPASHLYEALVGPFAPLYVWRPHGSVTRFVGSACVYAEDVVLAGERLALDCDQSGADTIAQSLRVYDLRTRRPRQVFSAHSGGTAGTLRGTYLAHVVGSGRLVAFGTAHVNGRGVALSHAVWRIDGARRVKLRSGGDLVAADGDRLAVELADGRVAIVREDGTLLHVLPLPRHRPERRSFFEEEPKRRIVLAGRRLLVSEQRTLRTYDSATGALEGRLRLPRHSSLEAADERFVVYVSGSTLHVRVGQTDVATRVPADDRRLRRRGYYIEQRVHADLTPAGLFYCFDVADRRYPGRVVFVPRATLLR